MKITVRSALGLAALAGIAIALPAASPAQAAHTSLHPLSGRGSPPGSGSAIRAGRLGPAVPGRVTSVAATSAGDVWAVGLTSGPPLILHWNGSAWLQYPISPDSYLLGVSAPSADNAWAVGGTYWFSPTKTVAYHWNGKTWSR